MEEDIGVPVSDWRAALPVLLAVLAFAAVLALAQVAMTGSLDDAWRVFGVTLLAVFVLCAFGGAVAVLLLRLIR